MEKLYYVTVQFEDLEQVEYCVHADSTQAAVDFERNRLREAGILCDVVRVALCQTDWY